MKLYVLSIFCLAILCCCPAWGQKQRGKATFYSRRATGARAASGERIHHDSLTCAHRSHPFGTMLRVTNLGNGRQVDVRVTDRGPYGRGKIIDLSYAAAKEIGLVAQGVGMVEVEVIDNSNPKFPLKMKEKVGLPDIDLEQMPVEYRLTEDWKPKKSAPKIHKKRPKGDKASHEHKK